MQRTDDNIYYFKLLSQRGQMPNQRKISSCWKTILNQILHRQRRHIYIYERIKEKYILIHVNNRMNTRSQ